MIGILRKKIYSARKNSGFLAVFHTSAASCHTAESL